MNAESSLAHFETETKKDVNEETQECQTSDISEKMILEYDLDKRFLGGGEFGVFFLLLMMFLSDATWKEDWWRIFGIWMTAALLGWLSYQFAKENAVKAWGWLLKSAPGRCLGENGWRWLVVFVLTFIVGMRSGIKVLQLATVIICSVMDVGIRSYANRQEDGLVLRKISGWLAWIVGCYYVCLSAWLVWGDTLTRFMEQSESNIESFLG